MTEEEKKAIETLKGMIQAGGTLDSGFEREEEKIFQTILNLIEKLQKENEELRQNYDIATTEIEELKEQKKIDMYLIGDSISKEIVKRDYIPKDKIREEIEIQKSMKVEGEVFTAVDYTIKTLELLEEE